MDSRVLLMILLSVSCSAVAQISMKIGMSRTAIQQTLQGGRYIEALISAMLDPNVFAGFVLYFFAAMNWLVVLSRVDVSMAYPFAGLSFVITVVLGGLLLGETVGVGRLLGLGLVVLGICILARS